MKKLLIFLFLGIFPSVGRTLAQPTDSLQVVVDSLSVKVVKLERDLEYLKINTDISTLNTEIEILSMKVNSSFTDIQIGILYNDKKDTKDLLRVLRESCKHYKENVALIKDEVDSMQELVYSKKGTFSSNEYMCLSMHFMKVLFSYDLLEKRLSLLDEALDK
ncbi:hypothetical protein [uncultured Alistipes sp.]|uniref:hypothetical protein n=1 Tax=uncultured Alistipes sp. TaxID=538949 RepID=UPI00262A238B|nr:hypothetical protein [uncultured Alistipes sp.]